jgi:hypothetical protein
MECAEMMRLTSITQLGLFIIKLSIFTYSYFPTSGAEHCSCLLQNHYVWWNANSSSFSKRQAGFC